MATDEVLHEDKESNRKKFSNWLQCVHSLKETKTALHDHVLKTFKAELISWDPGLKTHIPQFLRCVAEERIDFAKRKGIAKREWHCNCEHSDCNKILKKLLNLQQNQGVSIVWKTEICEKLAKNELESEPDKDDAMDNIPTVKTTELKNEPDKDDDIDNIPTVETTDTRTLLERLLYLFGMTSRKQATDVVNNEDIFDDCTRVHVWCIANMFMQRGKNKTNIFNTGPGNTDASMFFKMMMNCKLFEIEDENDLYDKVIMCRDRLHHSANNRVGQVEAKTNLNTMIKLLAQFEHVAKCKTAIRNIEKMLKETILVVAVPNENLERLRLNAEEALKEKKTALEVDKEINKTSGFSNNETTGLLEETKEQLDGINKSQPIEVLIDKMKSREDYKREKAEYEGHKVKKLVTSQSKHSPCTNQEVKDQINHLKKMVNLVESCQGNSEIAEAVTGQLIPFLDQIFENASKTDEQIKKSLEEVYHQEKQELLEQTPTSRDFDTGSLIPQRKEDDKSVDQDLKDKPVDRGFDHQKSTKLILDFRSSKVASLCHSSADQNQRYLWYVIMTHLCCVRVRGDVGRSTFLACCRISLTEIVLADCTNKKLKRFDTRKRIVTEILDLVALPFDICSVGDDECVVALPNKIQFVDVTGKMSLGKSFPTNHDCFGLAYYNTDLYVIDDRSVYLYKTNGTAQTVLYTYPSANSRFRLIAISDDGGKIYITDLNSGLVTIDTSRNHMNTTLNLDGAYGVCVDSRGQVLVCGQNSTQILQISSDGTQKIGTIENNLTCAVDNTALYFDRQNDVLITAGTSGTVTFLKLQ